MALVAARKGSGSKDTCTCITGQGLSVAKFPDEPPLVLGAAFANLILKISEAEKRRDFMLPKTGEMARVTRTVFGTLCGMRPLCRAYIKKGSGC